MNTRINKKATKCPKGFTLVEILIATIILAFVMTMTTGVVGQSVGFQAKTRAIRKTSMESRRVADMISRDIREARGSFKIAYDDVTIPLIETIDYKNGLGVFECIYDTTNCIPRYSNALGADGNTLVLAGQDKIKIFWVVKSDAKIVYYYEFNFTDLNQTTGLINGKTLNQIIAQSSKDAPGGNTAKFLIAGDTSSVGNLSTPEIKTVVKFNHFYCPNSSTQAQKQTFIELDVETEIGVSGGPPQEYSKSSVQTTITSRDYN